MERVCGQCGCGQISESAKFCYSCGASLDGSVPNAAALLPHGNGAFADTVQPPGGRNRTAAVLIAVGTLVMYLIIALSGYSFYRSVKKYRPTVDYFEACGNAGAIYNMLSDEMSLDSSDFDLRNYSSDKAKMYAEVLRGGVYDCGSSGDGVQGVVYRAMKQSGSSGSESGRAYVGFDVRSGRMFVQWQPDEDSGIVGQYPEPPSPSESDGIVFGRFYSSDEGGADGGREYPRFYFDGETYDV